MEENEQALINASVRDLIPMLISNKELCHVRQSSFDHYVSETGEIFQVQVTVTRDESEFLDFLETEALSNY